MLHPSTRKLIERLAEVTSQGKLPWQEDNSGGVVYAADGFSVVLSADPFSIGIRDRNGRELEMISLDQLEQIIIAGGGSYADLVAIMYDDALRSARGTETAIVKLLASLEDTPFTSQTGMDDAGEDSAPARTPAQGEQKSTADFEPISEQVIGANQSDHDTDSSDTDFALQDSKADNDLAPRADTDEMAIDVSASGTEALKTGLDNSGIVDTLAETDDHDPDGLTDMVMAIDISSGDDAKQPRLEEAESIAKTESHALPDHADSGLDDFDTGLDAAEAELTQAIASMADHVNRTSGAAPSDLAVEADASTIPAAAAFAYVPFGLTQAKAIANNIDAAD